MTKKPESDDHPDPNQVEQFDMFDIEPVQKQQIRKRTNSASKSQKIINRLKSQLETFRFIETIKGIKIKIIEYDCVGIFGNFADPFYDVARVRFIFKKDILLKREMRLAPFDSNILLYKEEYDPSGQMISFSPHEKLARNFVIEKNILRLDKKDDWYGEDDSDEDYYIPRLTDWIAEVPTNHLHQRKPNLEYDDYDIFGRFNDPEKNRTYTKNESMIFHPESEDYMGGFCGFAIEFDENDTLRYRQYYRSGKKYGIGMHFSAEGRLEKLTHTSYQKDKETETKIWDSQLGTCIN
tara:strand:- start:21 stop:902 length:882 start_codon:yes stop_codon:yes gene_type:complete